MMAAAAGVSALQDALAAENAAIFGYGVAGARLTGNKQATAQRDWLQHRLARDNLIGMITRLGATADAAQVYYQLPFTVRDQAQATALAAYLEDGVTRAYLGLVAVTTRACGRSARWRCRPRRSEPRSGAEHAGLPWPAWDRARA